MKERTKEERKPFGLKSFGEIEYTNSQGPVDRSHSREHTSRKASSGWLGETTELYLSLLIIRQRKQKKKKKRRKETYVAHMVFVFPFLDTVQSTPSIH